MLTHNGEKELVPEGKGREGSNCVMCTWGCGSLPVEQIELEGVKAAVSENFPISVLLRTDVLELGQLLRINPRSVHSEGMVMNSVGNCTEDEKQGVISMERAPL